MKKPSSTTSLWRAGQGGFFPSRTRQHRGQATCRICRVASIQTCRSLSCRTPASYPAALYLSSPFTRNIVTCPPATRAVRRSFRVSGGRPRALAIAVLDSPAAPAWAITNARRSASGGSWAFRSQSWKGSMRYVWFPARVAAPCPYRRPGYFLLRCPEHSPGHGDDTVATGLTPPPDIPALRLSVAWRPSLSPSGT